MSLCFYFSFPCFFPPPLDLDQELGKYFLCKLCWNFKIRFVGQLCLLALVYVVHAWCMSFYLFCGEMYLQINFCIFFFLLFRRTFFFFNVFTQKLRCQLPSSWFRWQVEMFISRYKSLAFYALFFSHKVRGSFVWAWSCSWESFNSCNSLLLGDFGHKGCCYFGVLVVPYSFATFLYFYASFFVDHLILH